MTLTLKTFIWLDQLGFLWEWGVVKVSLLSIYSSYYMYDYIS